MLISRALINALECQTLLKVCRLGARRRLVNVCETKDLKVLKERSRFHVEEHRFQYLNLVACNRGKINDEIQSCNR